MKLLHTLWLSIACVLCLSVGQVQAVPITTLFNTGVDGSGTPLLNGSVDPHYTLISAPTSGTPALLARDSGGGFPVDSPYTLPDGTDSRWIIPHTLGSLEESVGSYVYQTTFNLTGFNPATASIAGLWSTDNNGLDILINGTSLGFTTGVASFITGFTPFLIPSGLGLFNGGVNTLAFHVNNAPGIGSNPTALRVEMTSNAVLFPVPEPASLLLLGSGLLVFAALWRKQAA